MSKPDEYRAKAQECERMAAISRNPIEKTALLQLAQQGLGMIPMVGATKSNAAGTPVTRQTKSEESH